MSYKFCGAVFCVSFSFWMRVAQHRASYREHPWWCARHGDDSPRVQSPQMQGSELETRKRFLSISSVRANGYCVASSRPAADPLENCARFARSIGWSRPLHTTNIKHSKNARPMQKYKAQTACTIEPEITPKTIRRRRIGALSSPKQIQFAQSIPEPIPPASAVGIKRSTYITWQSSLTC